MLQYAQLIDFKFDSGLSFIDSRVYSFTDNKGNELIISEKVGNFINGDTSDYLLFQIDFSFGETLSYYVSKKSDLYLNLPNISAIIGNLNGIVKVCRGCGHIVLSEDITGSNDDKCIFCDKYLCKKCRRLYTLRELDENRLCKKCRSEE